MRILHSILHAIGIKSDLHKMLFKNTVWGLIGEASVRAAAAVLVIFIARYLGTMKYGEIQFAFSFSALFAFALSMGFPGLMVREVARDKSMIKKYAENVFLIKIILSLFSFALLSLIVVFLDKSSEVKWLVVLGMIYVVFVSFVEFFTAMFAAFDKMVFRALSRIVGAVFLLVFGGFVLFKQGGVTAVMIAYVASEALALIFALVCAQLSVTRFFVQFDWKFWKEMTIKMLPFALFMLISTVYNRIDMVMLSFIKGEDAVGVYAAGFNMYSALQMIPWFISYAVYPTLARSFTHDIKQLRVLFKQYFWIALGIGGFVGLCLAVFGKFVINILFGSAFAASGAVVQYFGFSFAFASLLMFFTFFYASINDQRLFLQVLMLGVILGVVLNYAFIPKLSYVGAVIATIAVQIYNVIMLSVIAYRKGYRVLS